MPAETLQHSGWLEAAAGTCCTSTVRRPLGAPEPLPMVVWSHGGAHGRKDAAAVATEWGRVLTGDRRAAPATAARGRAAATTALSAFFHDRRLHGDPSIASALYSLWA